MVSIKTKESFEQSPNFFISQNPTSLKVFEEKDSERGDEEKEQGEIAIEGAASGADRIFGPSPSNSS